MLLIQEPVLPVSGPLLPGAPRKDYICVSIKIKRFSVCAAFSCILALHC